MPQRRIEGRSPAIVEPNVAASGPAELLKPLAERAEPSLCFWIVLGNRHQDPDPAHLIGLLRPRSERPRHRRPAKKRDERAAVHSFDHSITWSASNCSELSVDGRALMGMKRCTSRRDNRLSNAKGQESKSLILLARGGSGSPSLGTPDMARRTSPPQYDALAELSGPGEPGANSRSPKD